MASSAGAQDAKRGALAPPARVLGQLLASQGLLSVLPSPQHLAEFHARSLSPMPGVSACRVYLADCSSRAGPSLTDACAGCESQRATERATERRRRAGSRAAPPSTTSPRTLGFGAVHFVEALPAAPAS